MIGISKRYIDETLDEKGVLTDISFKNEADFNFAYDIVDELAKEEPDKMCMLWVDKDKNEKTFTFKEMSRYSTMTANYFRELGIKKGDRVMLVLKRHYQFWFAILALHKLGASVIPATHQLKEEDFTFRFEAGDITALVCTHEDDAAVEAEKAMAAKDFGVVRIMTGTAREGWHAFDEEMPECSDKMDRVPTKGDDPMLMFFTSGTTGYPKIVTHNFKYPLGHYITAKYWQHVDPEGIHFSVSDTGWGKALWGKLYGQWLCEAAVFVYDMESFVPHDFLSLFSRYNITTFCAPPTAYRVFVKRDLSKYGICDLQYATTAGEALNAEVWQQFYDKTGLKIMEGFGQTETTLTLCNLFGTEPKPGSMGRPSPMYDIDLIDAGGQPVAQGETGEVVVRTDKKVPDGLFSGYYGNEDKTSDVWYDDIYHTGDTAYMDEDGYYWYVGRTDDLIKSCGYRVGPFEVESVLMELPYILECAVTGVPDKNRGQRVKATVVLTEGTEPAKALSNEIMAYSKEHMAHYKCPRIVEFVEELPKTISGKVRRVDLRNDK
ncbi:MAG: AMP-binding protein [Eubacteriaceae bacterium]|nr:AMP-binding protein [Eubacteriaceae bacterium]